MHVYVQVDKINYWAEDTWQTSVLSFTADMLSDWGSCFYVYAWMWEFSQILIFQFSDHSHGSKSKEFLLTLQYFVHTRYWNHSFTVLYLISHYTKSLEE